MKNEPYLVTGTIVDPSSAPYHSNVVVATVVSDGGVFGDPYAPTGGYGSSGTGLVVTASPLNMAPHFVAQPQFGHHTNTNIHNQNRNPQDNSVTTCGASLVGFYVCLALLMIVIGIVCLATLPPGHCVAGCEEKSCEPEPAEDDRTSYPCTCDDVNSANGERCDDVVWNGPGTAQLTAGATLLSLGSLMACCSPCWCCLIFGSMHMCKFRNNRVAVDNYGGHQNHHHISHY